VADINVERKGPSIWPWVIGLVVLALLIWALVEMFGGETDPIATDPARDTVIVDTPTTVTTPPPAVAPAPPAAPAPGAPGTTPGTDTIPIGTTPGAAPGTTTP
jgi:hypothetical protein